MSALKKVVRLALVGLGFIIAGGTAQHSLAAPTDTINVTVSVDVVSISIGTTTWAIGQVAPGDIAISSAIPVLNDGNRQEDYSMQLTYSGGWTVNTSSGVGTNIFALLGLFTTTPVGSLTSNMFGADSGTDDVIDDITNKGASTTEYARSTEGAGAKGYDISASGTRTLHLNFRAPSANTVTTQQSMTVTVTAAAG